jgi:hypothetical protein
MNPNSISHRLFAAALSQSAPPAVKRPEREIGKSGGKNNAPRVMTAADPTPQKLSAWSWSGWQHTTI